MIEERTEEILSYPATAQVKKPRAANCNALGPDGEKLAKKPPTKHGKTKAKSKSDDDF
jgi:hypothetical protein